MKKLLIFAAFLVFAAPALATTQDPTITRVSHIFAMRTDTTVDCFAKNEAGDPYIDGAWGETFILSGDIALAAEICDGLLGVIHHDATVPLWERAIGVLVLVHESYHSRMWTWRADEARVECQAIRHFRVGAALLGATPEEIEQMFPVALAFHYRLGEHYPQYDYKPCVVPFYYPPGGPRH